MEKMAGLPSRDGNTDSPRVSAICESAASVISNTAAAASTSTPAVAKATQNPLPRLARERVYAKRSERKAARENEAKAKAQRKQKFSARQRRANAPYREFEGVGICRYVSSKATSTTLTTRKFQTYRSFICARRCAALRACGSYHNYDEKRGCRRLASGRCPFNHTHCHLVSFFPIDPRIKSTLTTFSRCHANFQCLREGHRAFECVDPDAMPLL